ncbi:putative NAD(P)-binding protein [Novosphingobium sp. PhB57]|nr:putative NAD(P)-binding protein [Novosphingobium sp. PhB57]
MFIVLGATGHVGSATAETLLKQGETVTVVTRDAEKAELLQKLGAEIAVADVHDVETMRNVFRFGKRLFLLNPPPHRTPIPIKPKRKQYVISWRQLTVRGSIRSSRSPPTAHNGVTTSAT